VVEDAVVLMDEEASCVGSEGIIIGSVNSFKVVGKQGGLSLHQLDVSRWRKQSALSLHQDDRRLECSR
jgi:hypothetical protein